MFFYKALSASEIRLEIDLFLFFKNAFGYHNIIGLQFIQESRT